MSPEITQWVSDQLKLAARQARSAHDYSKRTADEDKDGSWYLEIVRRSAELRETTTNLELVMSAYLIREEIYSAAEVARTAHITRAAASSRAGSAKTGRLLKEITG